MSSNETTPGAPAPDAAAKTSVQDNHSAPLYQEYDNLDLTRPVTDDELAEFDRLMLAEFDVDALDEVEHQAAAEYARSVVDVNAPGAEGAYRAAYDEALYSFHPDPAPETPEQQAARHDREVAAAAEWAARDDASNEERDARHAEYEDGNRKTRLADARTHIKVLEEAGRSRYALGGYDRIVADADDAKLRKLAEADLAVEQGTAAAITTRLLRDGGSAILDTPAAPTPIWGKGGRVLMAEGEALTLVGGAGVGKTTLAQQWVLGRCGLAGFETLLGLPVIPGEKKLLYIAADRPSQAIRSMRRMVTEEHRELLNERLVIWQGPPPQKITEHPEVLLELCAEADADSVVIDSLKDMGSVIDDEGGTGWNSARQLALVEGISVLEIHHNRKGKLECLDDVYGSTWLTAGAGSVVALVGKPGDSVVKLRHLKQPAEEVGPWEILHDHLAGRSSVVGAVDALVLAGRPGGISAVELAKALHETDQPTRNDIEQARRQLSRYEKDGLLVVLQHGRQGGPSTRWGTAYSA